MAEQQRLITAVQSPTETGAALGATAGSGQTLFGPDSGKTVAAVDGIIQERLLHPKWFTYFDRLLRRPLLNATIDQVATVEEARAAHPDLELDTGVNSADAGVVHLEGGGMTLTTAGAAGDNQIIQAHTDAITSGLSICNWDSANQPLFMANLVMNATITNQTIWAGFKLTNTPVTATDADQFFFRYQDTINGGEWQAVTSVAGVDDAHDTNTPVVASTVVRLLIVVDSDRIPRFFINGRLVETGGALTALNTFDFFIGVQAGAAAAASSMHIRNFMVSQLYG